MALRFGTSGIRGLVSEMTDRECFLYTTAFCEYLKALGKRRAVALAGDLRSSTPRIMNAVACAARHAGFTVVHCGSVPTPAVTLFGMQRGMASMMVTGSHIPDDRNGIKFNMPEGEVGKRDEAKISDLTATLRATGAIDTGFNPDGSLCERADDLGDATDDCADAFVDRFVGALPADALKGLKVVLYEQSAVGRDLLSRVLGELGAEVIAVARAGQFIPVDTEAVSNPEQLRAWVVEHRADALISTDGDSDRPLVVNERGDIIRGDVLGVLVADLLRATWVSTPVSCNQVVDLCQKFTTVFRTRVGSPFVIEGIQKGLQQGVTCAVGYEANGGFLTGTAVTIPGARRPLSPLPTRDAFLPILTILAACKQQRLPLSALQSRLPARATWSGLLRECPQEESTSMMKQASDDPEGFWRLHFKALGALGSCDQTDGIRYTFGEESRVIHIRPSGNAPEFRCYTEAASEQAAKQLNAEAMKIIVEVLRMNPTG